MTAFIHKIAWPLSVAAIALAPLILGAQETAKAQQQHTSNAGTLRCNIAGGGSFIVGSRRKLDCVYTPRRGRPERYVGRISRYGVDIGGLKKGKMIWSVRAPGSGKQGRGRLAGRYGGYGGQVAVIKGAGYQNLIGGAGNFMLIPTSFTGVTGVNLAVGIAGLKLDYVR